MPLPPAELVSTSASHEGVPILFPLATLQCLGTTRVAYLRSDIETPFGTRAGCYGSPNFLLTLPFSSHIPPVLLSNRFLVAASSDHVILDTLAGPYDVPLPGFPISLFSLGSTALVQVQERSELGVFLVRETLSPAKRVNVGKGKVIAVLEEVGLVVTRLENCLQIWGGGLLGVKDKEMEEYERLFGPENDTERTDLLWQCQVSPGELSVFMAHDLNGKSVICLVYGGTLTALSFREVDGKVSDLTPAFRIADVDSATPVRAIRSRFYCSDILVRHRGDDRSLSLFMGRHRACEVFLEKNIDDDGAWQVGKVGEGVGSQFSVFPVNGGVVKRFTLKDVIEDCPIVRKCLAAICFRFERAGMMLRLASLYHELIRKYNVGIDDLWCVFESVLLESFGQKGQDEKTSMEDVISSYRDWNGLLESDHHEMRHYRYGPRSGEKIKAIKAPDRNAQHTNLDLGTLHQVLMAIHLVYEEQKVAPLSMDSSKKLQNLNVRLAKAISAFGFIDHYRRDLVSLSNCHLPSSTSQSYNAAPSILEYLTEVAAGEVTEDRMYEVMEPNDLVKTQSDKLGASWRMVSPAPMSLHLVKYFHLLFPLQEKKVPFIKRARSVVHEMVKDDFRSTDVEKLPFGFSVPLQDAIFACRQDPDPSWPNLAFVLIGREDLISLCETDDMGAGKKPHLFRLEENIAFRQLQAASTSPAHDFTKMIEGFDPHPMVSTGVEYNGDGCELYGGLHALRFSEDRRIEEVRRLLRSTDPIKLTRPTDPSPEYAPSLEIDLKLKRLSRKRYATPVGRGAFTLRTLVSSNPTKPLDIPKLCTIGIVVDQKDNRIHLSDKAKEDVAWGEFHNGVAAGLRILAWMDKRESEIGRRMTRGWILGQKGQRGDYGKHGGILMGLGLGGYLPGLRTTDYYEYLLNMSDETTIGLMLGLALGNVGSKNERITKMMCLHIQQFNDHGFSIPDFNVSNNVQSAAIIGLGFLHMGSCEHIVLDGLFRELSSKPQPGDDVDDRESIGLSAGLAIGLVCLGAGSTAFDASNKRTLDKLLHFANGGFRHYQDGAMSFGDLGQIETSRNSSGSAGHVDSEASCVSEHSFVNTEVVTPGSILGIALIFLKTNNKEMAERIALPETLFKLCQCRPEHIQLWALAQALILWDDMKPTKRWFVESLPALLTTEDMKLDERMVFDFDPDSKISQKKYRPDVDVEGLYLARIHAITGLCNALALKYAGSNDPSVMALLADAIASLSEFLPALSDSIWSIMTCVTSMSLSLSIVGAGSGDLSILRKFRHLRKCISQYDQELHGSYGHHMAIHMAIGFLFMGAGCQTFANNNRAIAGLLCAIYPIFPHSVNDNEYHLQALRHCYVLATEPRYIDTRDVDTGQPCNVEIQVEYIDKTLRKCCAPCVVVEAEQISKIHVVCERYWSKSVDINPPLPSQSWYSKTRGQTIFVKRRTGHLPYHVDRDGSKHLMARSLSHPFSSKEQYAKDMQRLVRAFSGNGSTLAFVKYVCTPQEFGNERTRRTLGLLFECLTDDRPESVSLFISLWQGGMAVVKGGADPITVSSMAMVRSYLMSDNSSPKPLLGAVRVAAVLSEMDQALGYRSLKKALLEYVRSGGREGWSMENTSENGRNLQQDLAVLLRLSGIRGPGVIGGVEAFAHAIRQNPTWWELGKNKLLSRFRRAIDSVMSIMLEEDIIQ